MLNWAHIHLLVNDVPILGSLFAALLLAVALARESHRRTWTQAGLSLLAIATLGAVAAFFTGDPALGVIEGKAHTSARALSEHHVRSLFAISAAAVVAIAGVAIAFLMRKGEAVPSRLHLTILLGTTLVSAAALSWTGLAGGRIGHPELQLPGDRDAGPAHPH